MCAVSTDVLHVLGVCCIYKCLTFTVCVLCLQLFVCAVFTDAFHLLFVYAHVLHLLWVFTDACMCCLCAVFIDSLCVLSVYCVYRCLHVLCLQISYVCFLAAYTYMLLVDFQRYPSPLELFLMLWIFSFLVGEIHTVSTLYCIFSFLLGEHHPVNVLCTAFFPSSLEKFTL